VLLLLKLFLAPTLIAIVTLGARRWGPRVGGWLTGLPTVAGPTLCFYAFEQGPRFAARASYGTLVGLVAIPCFCLAYAYSGRRVRWPISLLAGWSSFLLGLMLFREIQANIVATWALLAATCTIGYRALPTPPTIAPGPPHSRWDLPLRMSAAAALVIVLTAAADRLGPEWSELLAPFPVATAIIASFTHAQRGIDSVVVYFRGFLPALISFGLFCLVLAVALEPLGLAAAIVLALVVQLSTQTVTLLSMTRAERAQVVGSRQ
jgi:hypothetical protein